MSVLEVLVSEKVRTYAFTYHEDIQHRCVIETDLCNVQKVLDLLLLENSLHDMQKEM